MPLFFVDDNLESLVKFKYHTTIQKLPAMSDIDGNNPIQKIMLAEALAKHIRWGNGLRLLRGTVNQKNHDFYAFNIQKLVNKIVRICERKPENIKEFIVALTLYGRSYYGLGKKMEGLLMKERKNTRTAAANLTPVRQRTQYTLLECLKKLAQDKPEYRKHLVPLIREFSTQKTR